MSEMIPSPAATFGMSRADFLARINRPGAFQKFAWASRVKPAAAHRGSDLVKISTAVARTGVGYENLAVNEGEETGSLPWGEWLEYPYVVEHKGNEYARLYLKEGTIRTRYFVDGQEVDRDTFGEYLTPSARKSSRPKGGTVTIALVNLTAL